MQFNGLVNEARSFVTKNSPTILTALAAAGVISTAVLAIEATRRSYEHFHENYSCVFPTDEKYAFVKTYWRNYVPTLVTAGVTITCLIGSTRIYSGRSAALAALYGATEKAFAEYKGKVLETVGESKEQKIYESVVQDRLNANPVNNTLVFVTGSGSQLCYDMLSGRYFLSDMETIRQQVNALNQELINDTWVPLNRFYSLLGLENISLGNNIGWIPDNLVELIYTSKIAEDGRPCLVLDYRTEPKLEDQLRYW